MTNRSQRGFSLLSAIFLLVVIAALGSFAVTVSTVQQRNAAVDVLGSRAYQAAKAGLEWGAFQITHPVEGAAFISACQNVTALPQPSLPANTQLSLFTVTLSCVVTPTITEGTNTLRVYQLTAIAVTATVATPYYAERQVSMSLCTGTIPC